MHLYPNFLPVKVFKWNRNLDSSKCGLGFYVIPSIQARFLFTLGDNCNFMWYSFYWNAIVVIFGDIDFTTVNGNG